MMNFTKVIFHHVFYCQESKEKQSPITSHLLVCETIFVDLLKSFDMNIVVVPLEIKGELNETLERPS